MPFWRERIAGHLAGPPLLIHTDGVRVYGDGWAPDVGWGLFETWDGIVVALAHPDYIAHEMARNLAEAYAPLVPLSVSA